MIPRALNAPLSWIGLMRVSEHEAAHSDLKRRLGEAESALAKQAEEIADLKDDLEFADAVLAAQKRDVDSFKPDALLWRAARLKRRGNK